MFLISGSVHGCSVIVSNECNLKYAKGIFFGVQHSYLVVFASKRVFFNTETMWHFWSKPVFEPELSGLSLIVCESSRLLGPGME